MTISAYGRATRATINATQQFKGVKDTLGTLQVQLSTGKTGSTFAALGSGATASLSLNAKLATLDGYGDAITDAQNRVKLASTGLQFISSLAGKLGGDLSGPSLTDAAQRGQAQIIAKGDLAEAIDTLNTDVNGRYLFSGRATDVEPVASLDAILKGENGLKGVSQVVTDRIAADLGNGQGGLQTGLSGAIVTISRVDPASAYGFTISSLASTGVGLTSTTSGTPPSATVNVAAQPQAGDVVTLRLNLPDGTTRNLSLKAAGTTSASGDTFAIGATSTETAANIKAALDTLLTSSAGSELAGASTARATNDFFDGAYPAGTVVDWYRGDDAGGSPRATAPVQIGDDQNVAIGLRANEPGLRTVLAALAAVAVTSFSDTATSVVPRFNAMADRASAQLLGPNGQTAVNNITTDLATASVTLGHASDRVSATKAQVQDSLDAVENISPEDVAAQLLATQTRLQASYQTTAAISKLSLTDFL